MFGPTPRQRDCLLFIDRFIRANGMSPSFKEISEGLGLRSRGQVHKLVVALEEKGLIERKRNVARAIRVLQTDWVEMARQ